MPFEWDEYLDFEGVQHIAHHPRHVVGSRGGVPDEGLLLLADEKLDQDLAAVVIEVDVTDTNAFCV